MFLRLFVISLLLFINTNSYAGTPFTKNDTCKSNRNDTSLKYKPGDFVRIKSFEQNQKGMVLYWDSYGYGPYRPMIRIYTGEIINFMCIEIEPWTEKSKK